MAEAIAVSALRIVRSGRTIVDRVSFAARFGAVTALLGPNGAGKSSIVKALAGILPCEGEVVFDGRPARALDRGARARKIAYVPQQSDLKSPLSVDAVVALGRYAHHLGRIRSTEADRTSVDRAIALAGIESFAGRSFPTLSQGERQRVLIARALASDARILLFDEPTSALDVSHALRIYALMRRLAQRGYCVLAVLHPLEDALDWTDEAVLLDRGHLVASGSTSEVIREGVIEPVYGVRLVRNGALGFRLGGAPEDGAPGRLRP